MKYSLLIGYLDCLDLIPAFFLTCLLYTCEDYNPVKEIIKKANPLKLQIGILLILLIC